MFAYKIKHAKSGHVSFKREKCLINKQFKYRTLGEMVALARSNGERPLPTRNGVYTGEMTIPVERTDRVNLLNSLMSRYDTAEKQLKDAESSLENEKKAKADADYRAKVIADYEASKQNP